MNKFAPVLLILLSAVVLTSGCIGTDPQSIAMTNPMISAFFSDYPNAEIVVIHYTENESVNIIDDVRTDCEKSWLGPKELYKVTVEDAASGLYAVAWLDAETMEIECAIKKGEGVVTAALSCLVGSPDYDSCQNMASNYISSCTPSTIIMQIGDSSEYIEFYAKVSRIGENCKLYSELSDVSDTLDPLIQSEIEIGMNMTCTIPLSVLTGIDPPQLEGMCTGDLYALVGVSTMTVGPEAQAEPMLSCRGDLPNYPECYEIANEYLYNCTPSTVMTRIGDPENYYEYYVNLRNQNGDCLMYMSLTNAVGTTPYPTDYVDMDMTCSIPLSEFSGMEQPSLEGRCYGTLYNYLYGTNQTACAGDVMVCPDGMTVGRNPGLDCEFNPCPEEVVFECYDSDDNYPFPQNLGMFGYCMDSIGEYPDNCANAREVVEYYCQDNLCQRASYDCLDKGFYGGCSGAACLASNRTVCTEVWFDEYQCSGDWLQRKYQNTNCITSWLNYIYCDYGCSNGDCVSEPQNCTEGWLEEYQCPNDWMQRKYQYENCTTVWYDHEYCDYGCSYGACIGETTNCSDLDNDIFSFPENLGVIGFCTDPTGVYYDFCSDSDTVVDTYCSDGLCMNTTTYNCTSHGFYHGCYEGGCIA